MDDEQPCLGRMGREKREAAVDVTGLILDLDRELLQLPTQGDERLALAADQKCS